MRRQVVIVELMNNKKLTLHQLSKLTKIPQSTVRYYRDSYGEFMPSSHVEGTRRVLYSSECVSVLKDIRKAQSEGLAGHEIHEMLNSKYERVYNAKSLATSGEQVSKSEAVAVEEQTNVMQAIKQLHELNTSQVQLTEHYKLQSIEQRDVIEQLTQQIAELKAGNSSKEERGGLLKRLFGL